MEKRNQETYDKVTNQVFDLWLVFGRGSGNIVETPAQLQHQHNLTWLKLSWGWYENEFTLIRCGNF